MTASKQTSATSTNLTKVKKSKASKQPIIKRRTLSIEKGCLGRFTVILRLYGSVRRKEVLLETIHFDGHSFYEQLELFEAKYGKVPDMFLDKIRNIISPAKREPKPRFSKWTLAKNDTDRIRAEYEEMMRYTG